MNSGLTVLCQAGLGLKLLAPSSLPTSASQSVETTELSYHTQPKFTFKKKTYEISR